MKCMILISLAVMAAMTNAQSDCAQTALMTTIIQGSTIPCVMDPCDPKSPVVTPSPDCPDHCFKSTDETQCYSRQAAATPEDDTNVGEFSTALADAQRFFEIAQPPAGLSGLLCGGPNFPRGCSIDPFSPNLYRLLIPPINIPYCHRIPCSEDHTLDGDRFRCHSNPGCYYDVELANVRQQFGHTILAGVPVCHRVIRNKKFHQLANQYIQSGQSWNGLQEQCFLQEHQDEIFKQMPGCYSLDVFRYIGIKPKIAGWTGITKRECVLIGGCASSNGCHYPSKLDAVQIRSGSDPDQNSFFGAKNSFGQPICLPFQQDTPQNYFSSYTMCLQSGCVLDSSVNQNAIQQQFYILVTSDAIAQEYKSQFWTLVLQGVINPTNWEMQYNRLRNRRNPLTGLGGFASLFPGPTTPAHNNAETLLAFSLTLPNDTDSGRHLGNIQTGNTGFPFPGGFPGFPSGVQQPVFPGFPIGGQQPGFGPFPPQFPSPGLGQFPFPGQQPCPYDTFGLPLTGKNTGCCDINLCYIPRSQIFNQYSGEASYYEQWGGWSECSKTCGNGRRRRSRSCVAQFQKNCNPSELTQEEEVCNLKECPVWGPYGRFGACSRTCGGGKQRQTRSCQQGNCEGKDYRERNCNTGSCPTYTPWGQYSPCPVTCGEGQHQRRRTCQNPGAYGCNNDPSNLTDTKTCKIFCGEIKTVLGDCLPYPSCYQTARQTCQQNNGAQGYCSARLQSGYRRCRDGQCQFCGSFVQCPPVPRGPIP